MALLRGKQDQIIIPLTAEIDGDHGATISVDFSATVKKLDYDAAQAVLAKINASTAKDKLADVDLVRLHVIGWEMPGEGGELVPFTAANLTAALAERGYRIALVEGVMQMLLGKKFMESARRKN